MVYFPHPGPCKDLKDIHLHRTPDTKPLYKMNETHEQALLATEENY